MTDVRLAGGEAASYEKLIAALRHAAEAADRRHRPDCRRAVLQAIEGATELGVYLSDGRWAQVALSLENAKGMLERLDYGAMVYAGSHIADQFRQTVEKVTLLRHGRTGTWH